MSLVLRPTEQAISAISFQRPDDPPNHQSWPSVDMIGLKPHQSTLLNSVRVDNFPTTAGNEASGATYQGLPSGLDVESDWRTFENLIGTDISVDFLASLGYN